MPINLAGWISAGGFQRMDFGGWILAGGFRRVDFGLGGFQMGGFRQVEMSRWKMAGGFQLSAHDCCFLFEERAVHWVLGD